MCDDQSSPNDSIEKPTTETLSPRSRRAREEQMDVTLARIGVYTVHSQSGSVYEVNVFETSCTCPDCHRNSPEDGCKHIRRVKLEIRNETVPRPDGRLPQSRVADGGRTTEWTPESSDSAGSEQLITGPHTEYDKYGSPTGYTYYRCTACGREALQRCDLRDHPSCSD